MDDVRVVLQREADRMTESDDGLEQIFKKVARRQRRRGLMIGAAGTAATVLAVGALWIGLTHRSPTPLVSPPPTPQASPGLAELRGELQRLQSIWVSIAKEKADTAARAGRLNRRAVRLKTAPSGETPRERQHRMVAAARVQAQLAGVRARAAELAAKLGDLSGRIRLILLRMAAEIIGGENGDGRLTEPVVISPVQGITFDPPPQDATPALSAAEAIAEFQSVDKKFRLPADATSYLGVYTAPVGDGSYRFRDRLAWGIRWRGCPPSQGFVQPSLASSSCHEWLFLDANTGVMLEAVSEQ
jgi:hypothetical protein